MVRSTPQDELKLVATSAADEAGFVALHDVASLLQRPEFRTGVLIGGHMVSLHAQRWGLGLLRETLDADFGIPQLALNTTNVGPAMEALGYERARPNRFSKSISAHPADADGISDHVRAVIDILVPALASRVRKNVVVGDVTTIEVPGLAEALNRSCTVVALELTLCGGQVLAASIKIPDERSALILKAMAWDTRREGKDAVDVWRCLEIARVASLTRQDFASDDGLRAMQILERAFASDGSDGVNALARAQQLSSIEARKQVTRLRALIQRIR